MDSAISFSNGDKVLVNDKGRAIMQEHINTGFCRDTLPEILEGHVVAVNDYVFVRLPMWYPGFFGGMKCDWPFMPDELILS